MKIVINLISCIFLFGIWCILIVINQNVNHLKEPCKPIIKTVDVTNPAQYGYTDAEWNGFKEKALMIMKDINNHCEIYESRHYMIIYQNTLINVRVNGKMFTLYVSTKDNREGTRLFLIDESLKWK